MKIRYLISRQKERQTDRDRLCVKCVCFNLKNEDYKFDIYIERQTDRQRQTDRDR